MLTSWKNVSSTIFMQISAAITEKGLFRYNKKGVYTHILRVKEDNKTILEVI